MILAFLARSSSNFTRNMLNFTKLGRNCTIHFPTNKFAIRATQIIFTYCTYVLYSKSHTYVLVVYAGDRAETTRVRVLVVG